MNRFKNPFYQKGQIFITLLFFVIIGVTIISAEAIVLFTNILSASSAEQGTNAYYVAESGAEEALLRLLRNPSYIGGVITVGSGNAVVQINGNIITSTGTYASIIKKIQIQTVSNNGVLSIVSWKEI